MSGQNGRGLKGFSDSLSVDWSNKRNCFLITDDLYKHGMKFKLHVSIDKWWCNKAERSFDTDLKINHRIL